ncbi:MAG: hypothetical protein JWM97_1718 [Phycisphaerales bacterium]|nr:hypothetical protein [Phycisphaerales bacterium]
MPLMIRRLFTLLSALSLLLFMGTCALWFRSMGTADMLGRATADRRDNTVHLMLLESNRGSVMFHPIRETFADAPSMAVRMATVNAWPVHEWRRRPARPWGMGDGLLSHLGFGYRRFDNGPRLFISPASVPNAAPAMYTETDRMIMAPYWLLSLLCAAFPTWWSIARIRRARQIREGCCTTCGYDLRATPGRCPECGAIPIFAKVKA